MLKIAAFAGFALNEREMEVPFVSMLKIIVIAFPTVQPERFTTSCTDAEKSGETLPLTLVLATSHATLLDVRVRLEILFDAVLKVAALSAASQ